jgi:D-glycero-D-manno-heptose 1,7-bisphosphate phosphatase
VADQAAIFLDRDGTVIVDAGYPRDPAQVSLLPGAIDSLRRLHEAGFLLVVISNQSGIGRGFVTIEEAEAVHARFVEVLAQHGLELAGSYYCPHAPEDGCDCRKPSPGLLVRAADELGIDLGRSYLVGDKESDVEAAGRAGSTGVLFAENGNDWRAVTDLILEGAER